MSSPRPRVLSGIRPTGESFQLGNYIGAVRHWAAMQDENECYFFLADLHALTDVPDPARLRTRTRESVAELLAMGVDPESSAVFAQSHVREHAELGWVLGCLTGFGEASRMTQFKEKGGGSVGLFTYPVLQAADILMYQADSVPIGEDQRQHLELTRDLAQRFNARYGETFVLPGAYAGRAGEDQPGITNLLTILSVCTDTPVTELESAYVGKGYGDFKADVAEAVVELFAPVRERYHELVADPAELDRVLLGGAARAREVAVRTMSDVRERVGLLAPGGA
jgi:tryptophanyl-tRNA synthetase